VLGSLYNRIRTYPKDRFLHSGKCCEVLINSVLVQTFACLAWNPPKSFYQRRAATPLPRNGCETDRTADLDRITQSKQQIRLQSNCSANYSRLILIFRK